MASLLERIMTSNLLGKIIIGIFFLSFCALTGCSSSKEPKPVPEKYQSYKALTDPELKSGSLSLARIVNYDQKDVRGVRGAFYDIQKQQYSVLVEANDASNMGNIYELLTFDIDGRAIAERKSNKDEKITDLYWSHKHIDTIDGSVFFGTHYVDVFRKDKVTAVAYEQEIDISTLSIGQFKQLYDQADLVYYGRVTYDFETEELDYLFNAFMRIKGKWLKLTTTVATKEYDPQPLNRSKRSSEEEPSAQSASELFYAVSRTTRARGIHYALKTPKSYPAKLRKELINLIADKEYTPPLLKQKYMAKEKYVSCSLAGAFSPTGGSCKSGWTGAFYMELSLGGDVFQFKTYGDPSVFQSNPEDALKLKNISHPLTILQIEAGSSDNGLYLVIEGDS